MGAAGHLRFVAEVQARESGSVVPGIVTTNFEHCKPVCCYDASKVTVQRVCTAR